MTTEQKPEFEHQFKELEKYNMFTAAPGVQGLRSSLRWSSYRGNPRIQVFTNVPDDTHNKQINAPMNHETFGILMLLFDRVMRAEPGTSYYVENYTLPKKEEGSEAKREKFKLSETWVGKDKEGVMWISVRAEGRPEIVFKYQISDFHKIFKGNKEPLTLAESSVLQMNSVKNALTDIFNNHAAILKPPYDPNKAKERKPYDQSKKPAQKKEYNDLDDVMF